MTKKFPKATFDDGSERDLTPEDTMWLCPRCLPGNRRVVGMNDDVLRCGECGWTAKHHRDELEGFYFTGEFKPGTVQ